MPFFVGKKTSMDVDSRLTKSQKENTEVEIDPVVKLVEILSSVDTNNPDAELNTISISDGQGGRIYF